jgi:hypothetical protein
VRIRTIGLTPRRDDIRLCIVHSDIRPWQEFALQCRPLRCKPGQFDHIDCPPNYLDSPVSSCFRFENSPTVAVLLPLRKGIFRADFLSELLA